MNYGDRLAAALDERAWLRAAVKAFVADWDATDHEHHHKTCSRTSECDDAEAAEDECCYCDTGDPCPPCECGMAESEAIVDRARALLKEVGP
jgi:hypothetical protein